MKNGKFFCYLFGLSCCCYFFNAFFRVVTLPADRLLASGLFVTCFTDSLRSIIFEIVGMFNLPTCSDTQYPDFLLLNVYFFFDYCRVSIFRFMASPRSVTFEIVGMLD